MNKTKFTEFDISEIIRLYTEEKIPVYKIEKIFNITNNGKIKKILINNNIKIRGIKDKGNTKYHYNTSFWENIDTEAKAYFLGLMYADGHNIENKGFSIMLQEEDVEILNIFKDYLESNVEIKSIETKGNRKNAKRLTVISKKMSNDLAKLGCYPRKSLTLKFPTSDQVPDHLLHHFIRGYFDGDGSISIFSKQNKNQTYYMSGAITFTSSLDFCGRLQKILKEKIGYNFKIHKRYKDKEFSAYSMNNGGTWVVYSIYKYLYEDSTIYLNRKYNKFIDFLFNIKKLDQNKSYSKIKSSKYLGVSKKSNGRFRSTIMHKGKKYSLGVFESEILCAQAYDKKAKELHGKKAKLNFK